MEPLYLFPIISWRQEYNECRCEVPGEVIRKAKTTYKFLIFFFRFFDLSSLETWVFRQHMMDSA